MLEFSHLKYYLSSLKYPLDGEAIVPFALGTICILVDMFFLNFTSILFDLIARIPPFYRLTHATTYAGLMVFFFLLAFLSNMVQTSAEGKDTMCDSPQFIDRFEDVVVQPGFRSSIVLFTYTFPFFIAAAYSTWQIGILLLLAGGFFLPMVYMRTCIMENLEGMNPMTCLRFFARSPFAYLGLLLMSLVWAIAMLLPFGIFVLFAAIDRDPGIGLIILFPVLYSLFAFYITAVYMNILGRFYRKHESEIEEE